MCVFVRQRDRERERWRQGGDKGGEGGKERGRKGESIAQHKHTFIFH